MGVLACLERAFFRLFPTTRKETTNPNGEWLRCINCIATLMHFGMALFCMALVGFPAMILNILQCIWSYSVYLTLREREMCLYLLALLAQIAQSLCFLFRGEEKPTGAFQTGGTIGNIVGCGVMLVVGGRALWLFHNTGGLHYTQSERDKLHEPLLEDDDDDEEEKKDKTPEKKVKTTEKK